MQFHLNGFLSRDPGYVPPTAGTADGESDVADVLVIGAGPAGLLLAAQLSQFPNVKTRVIEKRPEPLPLGQADGVACRTVEMFNAFGLAERLVREAFWINETVFWGVDPDEPSTIVRTGRVQDVEDGLSEFPHVIVNQARLQDYLAETMAASPRRLETEYGAEVLSVEVGEDPAAPVDVHVRNVATGATSTIRARYVVGCDGARSVVRSSIGRSLHGDPQNHAWGVLDVLAETDFPDIRYKALVQSNEAGNVGIIPREGGYLVRLYVDLGAVDPSDREFTARTTPDDIIRTAQRVFHPYTLDVKELVWWSVYQVGQRLTDAFDDARDGRAPRVFIAGDACHTHSAKAGQGMNVSMQDAFNLGWKLGAVLEGKSDEQLLETYSAERQPVAQQLIDFDKHIARVMAGRPTDADREDAMAIDSDEIRRQFELAGRFTAGVATHYPSGLLIGNDENQALATGFPVGMRFHSAPVIRLSDAKPMHLGHVHEADGRWRLYAFAGAGDARAADSSLNELCAFLQDSEESPIRRHTPRGADIDAVFDVRAVLQQSHADVAPGDLHPLLLPLKGKLSLNDYEKVFTRAPQDDIYASRGIDTERGALIVVRPDQYVAQVLPLDAHEELARFFAEFMVAQS